MITLIKAIPPSFEEGYCPSSWQEFANKLIAETQFVFQSEVANSFYNFGDGIPLVDNRAFPWLRTIGGQMDRWYVWSANYGAWIAPYWPPSDALGFRLDWAGTEAELKLLDNPDGDSKPLSATTGPFWMVDHDFDTRFFISAGTLPDDASTILSPGDIGGTESIIMGASNLPVHRHFITLKTGGDVDTYLPPQPPEVGSWFVTGAPELTFEESVGTGVGFTREAGTVATDADPIPSLPPYKVGIKAMRTARKYYAV